jgi:hypothetical protein
VSAAQIRQALAEGGFHVYTWENFTGTYSVLTNGTISLSLNGSGGNGGGTSSGGSGGGNDNTGGTSTKTKTKTKTKTISGFWGTSFLIGGEFNDYTLDGFNRRNGFGRRQCGCPQLSNPFAGLSDWLFGSTMEARMPADIGSKQWAQNSGLPAYVGGNRLHTLKGKGEATRNWEVDPDTGDVWDQNGDYRGNLNDEPGRN